MALQSLNLPSVWPGITGHGNSAPALGGGDTLDASGEYSALVFCAAQDMVISHVGFKPAAVAGSPTADVRIETVDPATGVPTGTLWDTDTNIVTATLTTSFALHALTAPATVAKGQMVAVKFVYASGTSFSINTTSGVISSLGSPHYVTNITGSPVKAVSNGRNITLGSSATVFYPVRSMLPAASVAQNAFNNTSAARRGVRFQVPFRCQALGFRYYAGTAVGDFNAAIFDEAGAELSSSSTAFEGDNHAASAASLVELYFDNAVTLEPGTWYRFAIEPSSTTNCNMYTATLPSLNYRSAWPGGTNFHYTTYVTDAWTDTATDQVPFIDLLLKQFDDGMPHGSRISLGM